MKLLIGNYPKDWFLLGSVTTIGNFDGVHKGHQALLHTLKQNAQALGLPLVVILFEPQPLEYFKGNQAQSRLQSLREKVDALKQCGVDYVYPLKFNDKLAQMSAQDFAQTYLFDRLNTRVLMVGNDFHFGYQRKGDVSLLKELCLEAQCQLTVFPNFCMGNGRISSTEIRHLLAKGMLREASLLLGKPYALCGRIVKGRGLGRQWGIPTANVKLNRTSVPIKGVFCTKVRINKGVFLQGVANLGLRPTVDGVTMVLEIHLFDFGADLYGQRVEVFFLHKIRDELKFPSIDDLIQQIRADIATSQAWFLLENTL